MIYRSNLIAPDLFPHFKHAWSRPMDYAFGHDVISDWKDKDDDDPVFGIYKRCGFWTHDEAAILYNVAKAVHPQERALDIGAHTGWTGIHMAAAGHRVIGLDPMYDNVEFHARFRENTKGAVTPTHRRSDQYFEQANGNIRFSLIVIDGDHDPPNPQNDAVNAAKHLAETGVIMFHDGVGGPVREGVLELMDLGFKARAYYTPHLVFCCWRGDFTPPDHVAEPYCLSQLTDGRFSDFDFTRMV